MVTSHKLLFLYRVLRFHSGFSWRLIVVWWVLGLQFRWWMPGEDGWWVRAPGGRLSQPKALWPIQKEQFCLVRIYCPGDLPFLRIPLLFQTPQIKFAHCCPKLCMIYACLGYAVSFQWFGLNAFLVHSESHSLVSFRSWYQIPWNPMRTEGLRSGPLRQVV